MVTVLDVSHAKNRKDVQRLLDSGVTVEYFDHHDPGELIEHPNITYHINTEPNVSTGLIVNSHVNGKNRLWSVATAFGDNHMDLAMNMAKSENLNEDQIILLKQIGLVVNYNSYGQTVEQKMTTTSLTMLSLKNLTTLTTSTKTLTSRSIDSVSSMRKILD